MTPQDQEDHRLAALAANLKVHGLADEGAWLSVPSEVQEGRKKIIWWSPKRDKSDSFDLMVACGMDIGFLDDALLVSASIFPCEDPYREVFVEMDEKINTVEKLYFEAIFRCAVEIGRAKEGKANAQN